ncbi:Flagellar motor switch protein FliN [Rubripirellula obstinata]|uniref:Flagellar motor switch protein FliN n=1 Tax=Rubripirellula obstinata TaxID=406547 RepID=A0A5B1CEW0_9BACT|nr:flagellar motor switch protein FliN [Rubripirellula obstinata]KAA1259697.1 Flagellar motor switch protein FliN [Rubripirellula obstinata]
MADDENLDMEKEMAAAMASDAATSAESGADDIEKEMAAAMAADAAKATEEGPLKTDDIEALLDQATDSLNQATSAEASSANGASAFNLQELSAEEGGSQPIDLLGEVELDLRIELGRTVMLLEDVLKLRSGSVVALDKLAGDPVDVFVNGRLIARAEVLVLNDNFCVRVTELVGA